MYGTVWGSRMPGARALESMCKCTYGFWERPLPICMLSTLLNTSWSFRKDPDRDGCYLCSLGPPRILRLGGLQPPPLSEGARGN